MISNLIFIIIEGGTFFKYITRKKGDNWSRYGYRLTRTQLSLGYPSFRKLLVTIISGRGVGLICKLKGHNWGEWSEWEETEVLTPSSLEEILIKGSPQLIPKKYEYEANRSRNRLCNRCGKKDREYEQLEDKVIKDEEMEYRSTLDAGKVHNSEELRELVVLSKHVEFPPDDIQESIDAHREAKEQDAPIDIGQYITAGIEDISKHHSGSSDPMVRYEGFVIFVKKSPPDLSIGDKITVKITSFNKGDSANAVFVSQGDE